MATEDAKTLIEMAVRRFIDEVPALAPLKLVFAVELRGRGDVQMYRVELAGHGDIAVAKGIAEDARVRVEMPRSFFNVMAKEAHIADWREAFTYGQAKATGVEQILKLIVHVVEKQEERQRTRRARRGVGPGPHCRLCRAGGFYRPASDPACGFPTSDSPQTC